MNGFVQNIEGIAIKNEEFRRILYTDRNCQLVVMALKPKEEIGMEVHKLDQFFRVEIARPAELTRSPDESRCSEVPSCDWFLP